MFCVCVCVYARAIKPSFGVSYLANFNVTTVLHMNPFSYQTTHHSHTYELVVAAYLVSQFDGKSYIYLINAYMCEVRPP